MTSTIKFLYIKLTCVLIISCSSCRFSYFTIPLKEIEFEKSTERNRYFNLYSSATLLSFIYG